MSAATSVTAYDSNKSAAIPAQSPTLSPTLSAMVAALRGSSSGIFFSTFPTRSAPTSAAFVKIPPPTRINIASIAAPKPKPSRTTGAFSRNKITTRDAPTRPRPTVVIPTTPPVRNAICTALVPSFWRAASATRTFARTASHMPLYPTRAEKPAPRRKKMERPMRIAVVSAGSAKSKKKTIPTKYESVRNWRAR